MSQASWDRLPKTQLRGILVCIVLVQHVICPVDVGHRLEDTAPPRESVIASVVANKDHADFGNSFRMVDTTLCHVTDKFRVGSSRAAPGHDTMEYGGFRNAMMSLAAVFGVNDAC